MDVPRSRAASGSSAATSSHVDIPGASTSQGSSRAAPSARTRRERERSGRPKDKHILALRSIRDFLRGRSSYDVLPVSFRLIVLDTKLVVKPALEVMWQAGVVSAPLWQSTPPEQLANPSHSDAPPSTDPTSQQQQQQDAEGRVSPKTQGGAQQLSGFAGMLTVNDIIHLIQYYYHHSSYDSAAQDVEKFRLERLRDIEQALNVPPPPLLSVHPLRPLFDACQLLIKTHARRLPLLDYDEQTGMETVVSVLTQYRVLKFIAMNCRETASLWRSLRQCGIGTYCQHYRAARATASAAPSHRGSDASEPGIIKSDPSATGRSEGHADGEAEPSSQIDASSDSAANRTGSISGTSVPLAAAIDEAANLYAPIATATLDTTVFDVVHMFSERGISAVPILDEEGNVVDLYETVDVITLVRTGAYTSLDLTIRQALERRPPDFGGVWTCSPDDSLASVFALLRKRRVHRLLVLEPEPVLLKRDDFADKTAPLEELDSYVEDLLAEQKSRDQQERAEFLNDPRRQLEERLEKGDPVRKSRGRLVGIVCLSDILRYVIGSAAEEPDKTRSRGASVASSTSLGSQEPAHQEAAHRDATQTIPEHEPLQL
ncbi:CBS-domain-containing protein [Moesziomyces antarcticus]|uniref:Related to SNF4 - nuclear regulatory protein n=2 Tax=Pseudozyma antarctica TaxID=84753 RepID=A0A5C3FNR9_PSEA2|nr:CBS-domain-containing protein [Moesziomyces antarcticus]GAK64941.1 CBS-domain-containing protein [Moesziomyces antarcticus]SPO46073.1 related to SNF4 - nuclear regulatory protein [Moesziomyces antarcticus]